MFLNFYEQFNYRCTSVPGVRCTQSDLHVISMHLTLHTHT